MNGTAANTAATAALIRHARGCERAVAMPIAGGSNSTHAAPR